MDENDTDDDRISLTTLARLASSAAPPPPPDYEEVASTPAAPSMAPRRRRSGLAMGIGLGSLAGAAVAAAVVLAVNSQGAPAEPIGGARATAGDAARALEQAAMASALAAPSPSAPAFVERREEADAEPEAQAKTDEGRAGVEPASLEPVARATRSRRSASAAMTANEPEAREASPVEPAPAEPAAVAPTPAPVAPRPTTIAGLMEAAAALPEPATEGAPAEAPEEPSRLTPSRNEVTAAFEGLRGAIVQCAEGEHGVVELEITVGSSGRVRSALVTGHFSGTAKGSCMARAARSLSFPQFEQATFTARYPFRI